MWYLVSLLVAIFVMNCFGLSPVDTLLWFVVKELTIQSPPHLSDIPASFKQYMWEDFYLR